MARLSDPVRVVAGNKAKLLAEQLDVHTVGDLLRHYPRRYIRRGELTSLDELQPGEYATIFAEVREVTRRKIREKLTKFDVKVTDGKRFLTLTFFNAKFLDNRLPPGTRAFFAGKVEVFNRRLTLTNPEIQTVHDEHGAVEAAVDFAGAIVPIYPATKRLSTFDIERAVRFALQNLDLEPSDDPLPARLRERFGLMDLRVALNVIHHPHDDDERRQARKRLAWDEAIVLQTALALRRAAATAQPAKPRPARQGGLLDAFDAALPFTLTSGQVEVADTIAGEIAEKHPMHRLLQGEVGSGKTVVALRAMLQVVDAGGQAALLAPTEVLAAQHHRSITQLLGPLAQAGQLGGADTATRVALLTGSAGARAKREALLDAASGAAGIVVGTHALLQEHVQFADLGLVVVDEQHRFGVEQRDALREKAADGKRPHVLVMTATPIPRTVAMTVYGDLEVSTLTELPKGRSPIATNVVPTAERPAWLERVWQRVREEVASGRQAYVVCPRIGAGDTEGDTETESDLASEPGERPPLAVLDVAPMLAEGPLAGLRVELLHGRLPADEKDAVMRAFAAGQVDVLVATTVVEVGVDVPNATVMAVLDADRFGISQLHQLRGRVGRGSAPGLCLLVTDTPAGSPARERLDAVAETLDGFRLSELDLEQRREGTILGERQHGRTDLKLLSLLRDVELIRTAREAATAIVAQDPDLAAHPGLANAVAALVQDVRADYLEKA
jgi:ATP-dependent DNA helicase RecG